MERTAGPVHRPSVSWTDLDLTSQISAARAAQGTKKDDKKDKAAQSDLGKEIGLLYGGSLVINAIIGPGIFGTPKGVLAGVGSIGMSLVMWTFSGMFSMCAALCFAELRESVKREGVEYAYITEAFGPVAGFAYSWMRIAAAEPTATAVFALAFTDYVADAIYDDCGPSKLFLRVLAALTVLSMFLVNVMSTKLSERFQMLSSAGKLSALSVVIIMGVKRMIDGELKVINEGFKATKWSPTDLAFAFYNGLWAYGGWSNVNHVTSGIKKPPRNVPRVVKTVLPLVLVIYLLTVLSYFTAMTRQELLESQAIGVTWAQRVLGPADAIIYIGVGLTALGSLNGTFLSAGRLSGVAAKNGQMPDVASWVHVRSKTPLVVSGMRCIIAIMVMMLADGQQLLRFYIFIVWLFHGTSITALLILRYKNKKKKRPYKVDLWIPAVVVAGIACLLVAPFLQKPEKEFVAAVTLLGMSILSYYPITWLKSRYIINVPDNITIWLQLFLRVAPKRDLRRERKSILRQMDVLARNSIIITPSVVSSPAMMRRFSRRLSPLHLVQGSPTLLRRFGEDQSQTALRRRTTRAGSLAELDIRRQRMRSNSLWSIGVENKASPAIIRKKTNINHKRSLSQSDLKLKSPASFPILKNRCRTASTDDDGGSNLDAHGLSTSLLSLPHHFLRPSPSPIPEEDFSAARNADSGAEETKSQTSQHDEDLQVIADFESDGGGEYEVLAHADDVRRASFAVIDVPDTNSDSSCSSDSNSSSGTESKRRRRSMFASLFDSSISSSADSDSSTEEEGSVDEGEAVQSLPRFYYSEDEINSEHSGDESRGTGGYVNKCFVAEPEEVGGRQVSQEGRLPPRIQVHGIMSDTGPQSEV
ncbi:hypothetical protein BsWGS_15574 [Bradybaena similaris]